MQVLKNTIPKSMLDTASLNLSASNQLCVSAEMEERLPSYILSCGANSPKDFGCIYYNGTVNAFIKIGRSYQCTVCTYQFFQKKVLNIFPEINNLAIEILLLHVFNVFL